MVYQFLTSLNAAVCCQESLWTGGIESLYIMRSFRVQAAESQPAVVRPAGNKTVAVSSISSSEYVEEQLANLGFCFCFF